MCYNHMVGGNIPMHIYYYTQYQCQFLIYFLLYLFHNNFSKTKLALRSYKNSLASLISQQVCYVTNENCTTCTFETLTDVDGKSW